MNKTNQVINGVVVVLALKGGQTPNSHSNIKLWRKIDFLIENSKAAHAIPLISLANTLLAL